MQRDSRGIPLLDFEHELARVQGAIVRLQQDVKNGATSAWQDLDRLERQFEQQMAALYAGLTPWQKVQVARHPTRPRSLDYIGRVFTDFIELHGDRCFADDGAMVGGPAFLGDRAVMVVGNQKGRETQENVRRNFGMPHPEGFRKAQRLFRQAESLALPVITLIDTPGAAVSVPDEERGQAQAIAVSIATLMELEVPVISVVIGEGNSGGALALGVADRILMLEHAYFSVAAPEAAAAILWRSSARAPEAASLLGITAQGLVQAGLIDGIIPEPPGGAHRDHQLAATILRDHVVATLDVLLSISVEELLAQRAEKYRVLGLGGLEHDPSGLEAFSG